MKKKSFIDRSYYILLDINHFSCYFNLYSFFINKLSITYYESFLLINNNFYYCYSIMFIDELQLLKIVKENKC